MPRLYEHDPLRARLACRQEASHVVVLVDLRDLAVAELASRVTADTVTVTGARLSAGRPRHFCTTVRLPEPVDARRAEGRYEAGVLTLRLPEAGMLRPSYEDAGAGALPARPVLVVEDDEAIRACLSAILAEGGYPVETAPHGAAALEIVERARPSVILLDLAMPVMDGEQFARAYRARPGPHAPMIAVTAWRSAVARSERAGIEEYLPKPFDADRLLAMVGRHAA
jgi:CheY-like chemotaxis protein